MTHWDYFAEEGKAKGQGPSTKHGRSIRGGGEAKARLDADEVPDNIGAHKEAARFHGLHRRSFKLARFP